MPPNEFEVIDLTELTDSSDREDEEGDIPEGASEGSGAEVTADEVSRVQLHSAIATVSEARLRQLLQDLVNTHPGVEEVLTRHLVTKRATRDIVPRWEMCVNCEKKFDVNAKREEDECAYHPCELEIDEKRFIDWDEDCHGPMDTSYNRSHYPENFIWGCCGEDGCSEGCVIDEHRMAVPRKRRRF